MIASILASMLLVSEPVEMPSREEEAVAFIAQSLMANQPDEQLILLFQKNAFFSVNEKITVWDFKAFRAALLERDCALANRVWSAQRAEKWQLARMEYVEGVELIRGPALLLHCVSERRPAAYELYSFTFNGAKVESITLTDVSTLPAPPANSEKPNG